MRSLATGELANTFGNGSELAVLAGKEGKDSIGFTIVDTFEDDTEIRETMGHIAKYTLTKPRDSSTTFGMTLQ
jgi:hypothetical protein